MDYAGGEFTEDLVDNSIIPPISDEERQAWVPIVHFDIKPDNIFVGDRNDPDHPNMPIFKFGDFGISRQMPRGRSGKRYANKMQELRSFGTHPYYAPVSVYFVFL